MHPEEISPSPRTLRVGRRARGGRTAGRGRRTALVAAGLALALGVPGVVLATGATAAPLAQDTFDAGLGAWSTSGGTWSVVNGELVQSRSNSARARAVTTGSSSGWTNYTLRASVALGATATPDAGAGLAARYKSSTRVVRISLTAKGTADLVVENGPEVTLLGSLPVTAPDQFHALALRVAGDQVTAWVDDRRVARRAVLGLQVNGRAGLMTTNAAARFDNVLITPAVAPTPAPTTTSTTTTPAPVPSTTTTTTAPPSTTTTKPSTTTSTTTPPVTTSTTTTPTTGPTGAAAWTPPANLSAALDKVWAHEMSTYSNPMGFKNFIWDQLMATGGKISYCVRWDSTKTVTATQRDAIEAALQKQANKWAAAMTSNGAGWDGFPFTSFDVKVVGWATRDRSLLQWSDSKVDVYVGDINENAPQCAAPCGRFFNQTNDYSRCPGGAARHYDMSLWLTDGFEGGAGGDWGQRMGTDYFLSNLTAADNTIYLHEFGHGLGLDDFYDWDPGVGGFIMMAGSSAVITPFDTWMARDWWRHLKSRYGL